MVMDIKRRSRRAFPYDEISKAFNRVKGEHLPPGGDDLPPKVIVDNSHFAKMAFFLSELNTLRALPTLTAREKKQDKPKN